MSDPRPSDSVHDDAVALLDGVPLLADEAAYARAARAANTLRGYRRTGGSSRDGAPSMAWTRCRRPRQPSRPI